MELINAIIDFLFGHRYYANIVNTRGTDRMEISSFIFPNRNMADAHRHALASNRSYSYVQTISFRSRLDLADKQNLK